MSVEARGTRSLYRGPGKAMEDLIQQQTPSTMNSQELVEHALEDLVRDNRRRAWCQGEPITDAGKRRQIIKMVALLLFPVAVLIGIGAYFLADRVSEAQNNKYTRNVMGFSIELGQFMHALQRERDQSVLYLSNIGPSTKTFLLQRYLDTNEVLDNLSKWPVELQSNPFPYFRSKTTFKRHLTTHRNELDILGNTIFEELDFYNIQIDIFQKWVYDSVQETRYSKMWKSLIAYQKVVSAKSFAGIERALGANCFSRGGFTDLENALWYSRVVNVFRYLIVSGRKYSDTVDEISNVDTENVDGKKLAKIISVYRYNIQYDNITSASLDEAAYFFDNMTNYIDILLGMQRDVANNIIRLLDRNEMGTLSSLSLTSIILIVVIALVPILLRAVYTTTSDIQSYALTLADKTKELNREKRKTDSLLHQMLPKQVAKQLKQGQGVTAEYFKEVTVFFSDVVGFTAMTSICSPLEIVAMLNELYNLFDSRIDLYDVYKVETIKDSYMVASGIPQRNGSRHASEIGRLALDLLESCANVELDCVPGGKVRLRIGVHTGPVMAGIVGSKLPRYCLFGDTVNMASRMETTGQPDRIHISRCTYKILLKQGGFKMTMRGSLDVKGKGTTTTYWLRGYDELRRPERRTPSPETHEDDPAMSTVDLRNESIRVTARPHRNPTVSWSVAGPTALPRGIQPLPPRSASVRTPQPSTSQRPASLPDPEDEFPPPCYRDVERQFREKEGSPPIIQLQEGFHF